MFDGIERMRNLLVAKFRVQSGNRNSPVQTQAEEPCLLVLTLRRKPRDFGRFRGIKIRLQVIGCGRAQDVAMLPDIR